MFKVLSAMLASQVRTAAHLSIVVAVGVHLGLLALALHVGPHALAASLRGFVSLAALAALAVEAAAVAPLGVLGDVRVQRVVVFLHPRHHVVAVFAVGVECGVFHRLFFLFLGFFLAALSPTWAGKEPLLSNPWRLVQACPNFMFRYRLCASDRAGISDLHFPNRLSLPISGR